jgi:uncharacterized membrane protein YeaQ/YmgE (transglycosylase-associated protein family)
MDIFVDHFHDPLRSAEERIMMPDTLNLIIWLIAGIAGGNAAGDLLKGDYDLGLGNTGYGAIGGIVGALILQTLIPALRGVDYGPIIGQLIIAAASGAVLTVTAGAVTRWRRSR